MASKRYNSVRPEDGSSRLETNQPANDTSTDPQAVAPYFWGEKVKLSKNKPARIKNQLMF